MAINQLISWVDNNNGWGGQIGWHHPAPYRGLGGAGHKSQLHKNGGTER